ncbi:MAG TPA: decarboxylating 6-phosphogluconate dehydrogenase [Candidatus Polarisedimenticolaceae bacterium]|nr:decarboxylating 6-phosphogluconate dehydrogenase [Candidatus Polarisedimenticolaceae bacterium]
MRLAMIGLGRMGANMARRLMRGGHEVVAFDLDREAVDAFTSEGAEAAYELSEAVAKLRPPRIAWVMVPAGAASESVVSRLAESMTAGDIVVDGGNGYFKDDIRRHAKLAAAGVHYVDVGVSGGVWGLERGYSQMVGGDERAVATITPILRSLAPGEHAASPTPGREGKRTTADEGFLHCGPAGAGHFVKMVHNGIEYGLMQAYAEGFHLLDSAGQDDDGRGYRYEIDAAEVAEVWRRGSVIGSWLLDLTSAALVEDPKLDHYSGRVADSGEGRWTVMAAVEQAVPADVLSTSLYARFRSREQATFADKLLSAMRFKFGGHVERSRT